MINVLRLVVKLILFFRLFAIHVLRPRHAMLIRWVKTPSVQPLQARPLRRKWTDTVLHSSIDGFPEIWLSSQSPITERWKLDDVTRLYILLRLTVDSGVPRPRGATAYKAAKLSGFYESNSSCGQRSEVGIGSGFLNPGSGLGSEYSNFSHLVAITSDSNVYSIRSDLLTPKVK